MIAPSNGAIAMFDLDHGGLTTFTCNVGYQVSSSYALLCFDGAYNNSVTSCVGTYPKQGRQWEFHLSVTIM